MNNQEILEKAIQKAIDGGWKYPHGWKGWRAKDIADACINGHPDITLYDIIFNHDFAKALWGRYGYIPEAKYVLKYEEEPGVENTHIYTLLRSVSPWQYHLQNMVISVYPIAYLGDNLPPIK